MAIESTGHSRGNPRIFELIENTPKKGKSPTIWAWPEVVDFFRVAGQPVPGPWPPDQTPRPDPEAEAMPVAVPEPREGESSGGPSAETPSDTGPSGGGRSRRRPQRGGGPARGTGPVSMRDED